MPTSPYSVIYSFGDSLSDNGNVYLLSTSKEASTFGYSPTPVSPPYAQISFNGTAANVFSNGPLWTQDLAEALGLAVPGPSGLGATADTLRSGLTALIGNSAASAAVASLELKDGASGPNPYLKIVTGENGGGNDFAIGGAVTGPTTENSSAAVQLYDLGAQLTTFEHDIPKPVANALATVSVGGDDVIDLVDDANFATLYGSGTTLANVGTTRPAWTSHSRSASRPRFSAAWPGWGWTISS
jgi:phospholipase/lecithinase/hemolysin